MVIDHHGGHKKFGDISWVDDSRSSTGEMIYELAVALKAEISHAAAYGLYTAIVSDTGSFKYSSTSANTFHVAGELVAKGIKPAEVAGKLFDNYSVGRLRLLQAVLASLELYEENRIGLITVTRSAFAETGTVPEDTEDFISYPRTLQSVQVAVFIKEGKDNWISVSLRSKGKRDVSQIARAFGGGGHRNAAGFRLEDTTIDKVRERLLPELAAILT
jgi:phosphoesterase RecJ-like protein